MSPVCSPCTPASLICAPVRLVCLVSLLTTKLSSSFCLGFGHGITRSSLITIVSISKMHSPVSTEEAPSFAAARVGAGSADVLVPAEAHSPETTAKPVAQRPISAKTASGQIVALSATREGSCAESVGGAGSNDGYEVSNARGLWAIGTVDALGRRPDHFDATRLPQPSAADRSAYNTASADHKRLRVRPGTAPAARTKSAPQEENRKRGGVRGAIGTAAEMNLERRDLLRPSSAAAAASGSSPTSLVGRSTGRRSPPRARVQDSHTRRDLAAEAAEAAITEAAAEAAAAAAAPSLCFASLREWQAARMQVCPSHPL